MGGRGDCCMAQYAGSHAHDLSKVDKVMLRFRPIAPKPVKGNLTSDDALSKNREAYSKVGRTKRKYLRESNYCNSSKKHNKVKNKMKCNQRREASMKGSVMTLPLLPEAPVPKNHLPVTTDLNVRDGRNVPVWLRFENCNGVKLDRTPTANGFSFKMEQTGVTIEQPLWFAGSFIAVESVTDTWLNGDGLGRTDDERRANLRKDKCPGFLSDRLGRVTWTNWAYRNMISPGNSGTDIGSGTESMRFWLVMKEKVEVSMRALSSYPAFTCRVRLQYSCGLVRNSLTVPCDVWRMKEGGFAWRLDVEAGLSLSLGR